MKLVQLVGWVVYRMHPRLAAERERRVSLLKNRAWREPQELAIAEMQRTFPESVEALRRVHRIESELAAYLEPEARA
ncbi:MAG: hypothetical protein Q8K55_06450 [Gemmatimonadaceae bacterium]|nr:hypothetical protein [Gemmatimonadaceae bacterium]